MFLWLARWKRARAFVARAYVETIQLTEVGIADDLEAPQQRQAERPANSANDFQYKRKAAQRLDTNVNPRFFLSGFHLLQTKLPGARLQLGNAGAWRDC